MADTPTEMARVLCVWDLLKHRKQRELLKDRPKEKCWDMVSSLGMRRGRRG
jgi:hypothetical protein